MPPNSTVADPRPDGRGSEASPAASSSSLPSSWRCTPSSAPRVPDLRRALRRFRLAGRQLGVEHLTHWKKIALVTDVEWMIHLVRLFGWMTPGELRHFPLDERDAAIAWAAAD